MFVIILTYTQPLSVVDQFVSEHRAFLERHYATGQFVLSGRQEPRTGGVILATGSNRDDIERILQEDPFHRENVAEYDIIAFVPSMAAPLWAGMKEV